VLGRVGDQPDKKPAPALTELCPVDARLGLSAKNLVLGVVGQYMVSQGLEIALKDPAQKVEIRLSAGLNLVDVVGGLNGDLFCSEQNGIIKHVENHRKKNVLRSQRFRFGWG